RNASCRAPALPTFAEVEMTCTPHFLASSMVRSVEPSETTCTLRRGTSAVIALMLSTITDSSLWAGISTATSATVNWVGRSTRTRLGFLPTSTVRTAGTSFRRSTGRHSAVCTARSKPIVPHSAKFVPNTAMASSHHGSIPPPPRTPDSPHVPCRRDPLAAGPQASLELFPGLRVLIPVHPQVHTADPGSAGHFELGLGTRRVLEPHLVLSTLVVGVPEPRGLALGVVVRADVVLLGQLQGFQPGDRSGPIAHPVVAVERHTEH